tara:strand:- start:1136 stop:1408 length:273 start_codon:yes stop_codon:yes gene_type:complete
MTIKTEFSVKDAVYLMHHNAIVKGNVKRVKYTAEANYGPDYIDNPESITIVYYIQLQPDLHLNASEKVVFKTEAALLKHLESTFIKSEKK